MLRWRRDRWCKKYKLDYTFFGEIYEAKWNLSELISYSMFQGRLIFQFGPPIIFPFLSLSLFLTHSGSNILQILIQYPTDKLLLLFSLREIFSNIFGIFYFDLFFYLFYLYFWCWKTFILLLLLYFFGFSWHSSLSGKEKSQNVSSLITHIHNMYKISVWEMKIKKDLCAHISPFHILPSYIRVFRLLCRIFLYLL